MYSMIIAMKLRAEHPKAACFNKILATDEAVLIEVAEATENNKEPSLKYSLSLPFS